MAFVIGFTQIGLNIAAAESIADQTQDLGALGKEANKFGKELGSGAASSAPSFDGTTIRFKAGNSDIEISKDSLAPADNGKNIRYSYTAQDFENQKNLYNDDEKMTEVGGEQKDKLFAASESDSPTLEGEVYAILVDMAKRDKEDLSDEAFLEKTQEILGDMDNVLKDLVSCDADSALDSQYEYIHVEDLKQCQQVIDRSVTCEITHDYATGIVEWSDGPFNIDSCGDGCTQLWIGKVGDNYWGGNCKVYEEWTQVKVGNPQAITHAVFEYAKWDDYMMVYAGPPGNETLIWTGPYDWKTNPNYFPPETPGACELKTSWSQNPNVDVTSIFRGAPKHSLVNFKIRASVTGGGEAYGRIKIYYDPDKIVIDDVWKPKDCVEAAIGIDDGMAEGTVQCVEMPEMDSSGCAWINGAQVCDKHLAETPFNKGSVSKFCRKVKVTAKFTFNKGDTGCWKALVGFTEEGEAIYEEVCGGENVGGNLDTCAKYKDQGCKFVSSECTPGMTGASGTCYVNDVVYDCGKDVKVDTIHSDTTYKCEGIACLGEECIDVDRTYSTDFAKINALLNALQQMGQDMSCVGLDEDGKPTGDQDVTCTVFGGNEGYCKIAVGGWQDCCENPGGGPGVGEYIAMLKSASTAHQATISLGEHFIINNIESGLAAELSGQYAMTVGQVRDVLRGGMEYLGDAFSSVIDNLYGAMDYLAAPFKWFKEMVLGKVKEFGRKVLTKILAECGFGGTIEGGAAAGGGQLAAENAATQAIGTVMAVVGWVYLAYQVANLVIQLLYKCEEEEYETVSKRDTKNCHYVGSYCEDEKLGLCIVKHRVYCCFQSPLGRIINEQIKLTQPEILAKYGRDTWGDPEHPNCGGIPLEAVAEINWDLINLDEWTALLVSTGNLPTADNIDMDTLTGAASRLNWTGTMGTATDWGIPSNADGTTDSSGNATPSHSLGKSTKQGADRKNVLTRSEAKLAGQDIDGLRSEGAKCLTLVLGNGVTVRGGCGEESNSALVCRKNGLLIDCEELAYENALGGLLGNKPSAGDYWENGYRCTQANEQIDCSTIYSQESYIKALEEYARIIGGTTYLNRYVCLDKSGTFTQKICEHAMAQNGCECLPGDFICQDGNKPIPCSSLGSTETPGCTPGNQTESVCEIRWDEVTEKGSTWACKILNEGSSEEVCSIPVVVEQKTTYTIGCFEGLKEAQEELCPVIVTAGQEQRYIAGCETPIFSARKKRCVRQLNVHVEGSCTLGSSTSSSKTDSTLANDSVPGTDTLTITSVCSEGGYRLKLSTNSGGNSTVSTEQNIFDTVLIVNGNQIRYAGSVKCNGKDCVAEATMTVYRGVGTSHVYQGDVTVSHSFERFIITENTDSWSETCTEN